MTDTDKMMSIWTVGFVLKENEATNVTAKQSDSVTVTIIHKNSMVKLYDKHLQLIFTQVRQGIMPIICIMSAIIIIPGTYLVYHVEPKWSCSNQKQPSSLNYQCFSQSFVS